ncbi:MAG: hypothetical protein LKE54_01745 [Prevotella sp.]|jgi:hypothetical protein|nr:hypothetical protein [Prevotella sp.]MCH3993779.1 hypothetical protein [Prevotella sp.]
MIMVAIHLPQFHPLSISLPFISSYDLIVDREYDTKFAVDALVSGYFSDDDDRYRLTVGRQQVAGLDPVG